MNTALVEGDLEVADVVERGDDESTGTMSSGRPHATAGIHGGSSWRMRWMSLKK